MWCGPDEARLWRSGPAGDSDTACPRPELIAVIVNPRHFIQTRCVSKAPPTEQLTDGVNREEVEEEKRRGGEEEGRGPGEKKLGELEKKRRMMKEGEEVGQRIGLKEG